MGVYIKGMEMPTSCYNCPLCEQTDFYASPYCRISDDDYMMSINEMRSKRRDNCPLVPVPTPHGRLIDKDVICNECRRIAEEYDGVYPDCTYCPAHLAPTIIEAEEGE